MFAGIFYHGIDDKGRVIIPSRLRNAVRESEDGHGFMMTRGLDRCIVLYTPRAWSAMEAAIPGNDLSEDRRNFDRILYANSVEVTCDRQGRVVLPDNLKTHAGINKDVVIVGAGSRIEIWAQDQWDQLNAKISYEDTAKRLVSMQKGSESVRTNP